MKAKRLLCLTAAAAIMCGAAGCGKKNSEVDGKTKISIGGWPTANREADLAMYNGFKEKFEKKYPQYVIEPDTYAYDVNTFLTKASSNQLPTTFDSYFTEFSKIVDAGFAADISGQMEQYGYNKHMEKQFIDLITVDGKQYALPTGAYAMGLIMNMDIFKEAGLIEPDGTAKIPQTYEELAETASLIKKKTGKAGFGLPTMNNQGGWHFMNIAWSFGTEFMSEENGKWKVRFDSPECAAALGYVKDLKWKYDALPDNSLIDGDEITKLLATDQAAMMFGTQSTTVTMIDTYKMDRNAVSIGRMLEGGSGRYSLMGGGISFIEPKATEKQKDACFKWFEIIGKSPNVTEDLRKSLEQASENAKDKGLIVGMSRNIMWKDAERSKLEDEISDKYRNVNAALFKEYSDFENVTIRAEEPMYCQELYKTMDACIQEVLTDKNADPKEVIKKAASDFQKNYLDKA